MIAVKPLWDVCGSDGGSWDIMLKHYVKVKVGVG